MEKVADETGQSPLSASASAAASALGSLWSRLNTPLSMSSAAGTPAGAAPDDAVVAGRAGDRVLSAILGALGVGAATAGGLGGLKYLSRAGRAAPPGASKWNRKAVIPLPYRAGEKRGAPRPISAEQQAEALSRLRTPPRSVDAKGVPVLGAQAQANLAKWRQMQAAGQDKGPALNLNPYGTPATGSTYRPAAPEAGDYARSPQTFGGTTPEVRKMEGAATAAGRAATQDREQMLANASGELRKQRAAAPQMSREQLASMFPGRSYLTPKPASIAAAPKPQGGSPAMPAIPANPFAPAPVGSRPALAGASPPGAASSPLALPKMPLSPFSGVGPRATAAPRPAPAAPAITPPKPPQPMMAARPFGAPPRGALSPLKLAEEQPSAAGRAIGDMLQLGKGGWLGPSGAVELSEMPGAALALSLGIPAALYAGYKPVASVVENGLAGGRADEVEEAKRKYERAIQQQVLAKSGAAGGATATLDTLFDRFEKAAFLGGSAANNYMALMAALFGAGAIGGGIAGYNRRSALDSRKVLDAAIKQKQRERLARLPRQLTVVPVPIDEAGEDTALSA